MDSAFQSLMREATRLTQAGQLAEATAAIQLALRGEAPQENVGDNEATTGKKIFEGDFRVVEPEIGVLDSPSHMEPGIQATQSAQTAPPIHAKQSTPTELDGRFLSGSYRNHAGSRS